MKDRLIFKEKHIDYLQSDLKILSISSQINYLNVKLSIKQPQDRIL